MTPPHTSSKPDSSRLAVRTSRWRELSSAAIRNSACPIANKNTHESSLSIIGAGIQNEKILSNQLVQLAGKDLRPSGDDVLTLDDQFGRQALQIRCDVGHVFVRQGL